MEFFVRFEKFIENDAFITEWMDNHLANEWSIWHPITDSDNAMKANLHTVAHNKYSDWTDEEISAMLMLKPK